MLRFFLTFLYTYVIENVDVCALQFSLDPDIKIEIGIREDLKPLDRRKNIVIKGVLAPGWSIASVDQTGIKDLEFIPKPPEFQWNLPSGLKILKIEWSPSQQIEKYGFKYSGYKENFQTTHTLQILNGEIKQGKMPVKLKVIVPLCKDFCKVVDKEIEFDLKQLKSIEFVKNNLKTSSLPKEIQRYSLTEILFFIFSAFLGGLLLNAMPCVFPVLFLKIFDLIKLSESAKNSLKIKHAKKTNLFFIMGVVTTFLGLGVIQSVLNALGYWVGWGFQLQSPGFVFFLSSLFFIMSLNFFGVFEIGMSVASNFSPNHHQPAQSHKREYFKNFYSGMLLCVVATPCTAPFMGVALGATLTLPIGISMLVYLMLALGLTFPFICFLVKPKILSFIPKPGHWMEVLRSVMGFAALGSSLWLIWILLSSKPNILVLVLSVFWFLAFLLWVMGRFSDLRHSDRVRRLSSFGGWILVMCIVAGSILKIENGDGKFEQKTEIRTNDIQMFSSEKLKKLQSNRKSYLLNVTANWCVTCQWNKKFILNTASFRDLLKVNDILYMEADWSQYNQDITQLLNQYGSNSIPFLIYYDGKTHKTTQWSGLLNYGDLKGKLFP